VSKFERIGTNRGLKNDRDQMRRLAMVFTISAGVMLLTPVRSTSKPEGANRP
jgi:hypothetical protein